MSDAFDRFILARATTDYAALKRSYNMGREYQNNKFFVHQAIDLFWRASSEPVELSAGLLRFASFHNMAAAGELSKQLERDRPDLVEKYPQFPWQALKRLRDQLTHRERDGFWLLQHEKMSETAQIYSSAIMQAHQSYPELFMQLEAEDVRFSHLMVGLEFASVLGLLTLGKTSAEPVLLTDLRAQTIANQYSLEATKIPIIAAQGIRHGLLNALSDDLLYVSPFFKQVKNNPLSHDRIAKIIKTRNVWAHFKDAFTPDFSPDNDPLLCTHIDELCGSLNHFLSRWGNNESQANVDLASTYQSRMGKAVRRPAVREALNRAVEYIQTISKGDTHLENAYVMATYTLAQKIPEPQLADMLATMESLGVSVRKPVGARHKLERQSPANAHVAQLFLSEMQKFLPGQQIAKA